MGWGGGEVVIFCLNFCELSFAIDFNILNLSVDIKLATFLKKGSVVIFREGKSIAME